MKSVVFTGVGSAEVQEVPDPELRTPRDAIIEVERTAICGSDLHPYRGEWGDPTGQRPGHEFIGRVVEVGSEVSRRRVGERVLVSGAVSCGVCPVCDTGLSSACVEGMRVLGIPSLTDYPGGQADYTAVPDADGALLPIPDDVSSAAALLLTDNLGTGFQGVQRAGVREGSSVVVVGFGPVGMCAAMSARALGAWELFVIDPLESRRAFATALGCTALDVGEASEGIIRERTLGGADAVVETAGRAASIRSAFAVAHATGIVSAISVPSEPYPATPLELAGPTQRFRQTTAAPQRTWPALLPRLHTPAFARVDEVFSHELPLAEAPAAYELFANRPEACRKVQLLPG